MFWFQAFSLVCVYVGVVVAWHKRGMVIIPGFVLKDHPGGAMGQYMILRFKSRPTEYNASALSIKLSLWDHQL